MHVGVVSFQHFVSRSAENKPTGITARSRLDCCQAPWNKRLQRRTSVDGYCRTSSSTGGASDPASCGRDSMVVVSQLRTNCYRLKMTAVPLVRLAKTRSGRAVNVSHGVFLEGQRRNARYDGFFLLAAPHTHTQNSPQLFISSPHSERLRQPGLSPTIMDLSTRTKRLLKPRTAGPILSCSSRSRGLRAPHNYRFHEEIHLSVSTRLPAGRLGTNT